MLNRGLFSHPEHFRKRHRKGIFGNHKRINHFRRSSVHRMRSVRDLFACGRDRLSSTILRRSRSLSVPADFLLFTKHKQQRKTVIFSDLKLCSISKLFSKLHTCIQLKIGGIRKRFFSSNKLFDEKIRGISNVSKSVRQKNGLKYRY